MSADQPQPGRVVGVPDAEQLASPRFLPDQRHLLKVSIPPHQLQRVDMPLKQAAQR